MADYRMVGFPPSEEEKKLHIHFLTIPENDVKKMLLKLDLIIEKLDEIDGTYNYVCQSCGIKMKLAKVLCFSCESKLR